MSQKVIPIISSSPEGWQSALANAMKNPLELLEHLQLDPALLGSIGPVLKDFRMLVPHSYVGKMRPKDWNDPLLRQVLPLGEELLEASGFSPDPVGDLHTNIGPGLLHKYKSRVLLVTTGACAIHCRYCFRRHFPYSDESPMRGNWSQALKAIAEDSSVEEVILSGGDPLTLSDKRLQNLCLRLQDIPHIVRIRFHTRLPVVLPERIDHDFIEWFSQLSCEKVMVIHANHANEFDAKVSSALKSLQQCGTLLLNQTVLLNGVNNDLQSLMNLSRVLVANSVIPYYLHQLDRVRGAAHFEVDDKRAFELINAMRENLSGFMVPKLVREVSGEKSKTPLI